MQGGWTEDYNKFPLCRSRFVAKQIASSARDVVTQSTLALLVFRLMIAMCAAGLLGVNACFAVYDISVAFLHSRMDEVVFVHPPKADQLVKTAFCWRLRRIRNGTRADPDGFHALSFPHGLKGARRM